MIYRIYTEKKAAYAGEAQALQQEIVQVLNINTLQGLRLLNRYDVEDISEDLFMAGLDRVFSEPPLDIIYHQLPTFEGIIIASEYLPGQFDQRADSCAQCLQFIAGGKRPIVSYARLYLLSGDLSEQQIKQIKNYLINPVEAREASLDLPQSLNPSAATPGKIPAIEGFIEADDLTKAQIRQDYGLAMDNEDLALCQDYFRKEGRNPSLTELKVLDTYWSDHCRHTTFATVLNDIKIDDALAKASYQHYLKIKDELGSNKPITLMDIATIAAKYLRSQGKLEALDISEEVNACTVHVEVDIDGQKEPWLLLFKNETHNHPTEIEPFGGAATCIGGAIRDPLSGRGYVYQAMRLTGAADPLQPLSQTLPGKLPQRKITTTAAAGYSSYGNQIGLATGLVDEVYHPNYVAKRMEVGAVIAAAPKANVYRAEPEAGDLVVLLGGRTGRDGCGGATGSSKAHDSSSLANLGAEVQKGNAPEERKIQRLFRNAQAARLIKRCNDFGAGGVAVAIGELAPGLIINLDAVPKKYAGLDGTELAISESQERMAVVLAKHDVELFCQLAAAENLEATIVAEISEQKRLIMNWQGQDIVNLSRDFLDSNGASKQAKATILAADDDYQPNWGNTFEQRLKNMLADLNICSKQGLSERFDSTVGGGTVFLPFGGKNQKTPTQQMVAKLPVQNACTSTCSLMSYGFNPYLSTASPYRGAYLAVIDSVAKIAVAGGDLSKCWLSFQEYFPRLGADPQRWGLPLAALLGALQAQLDLELAAIGGKDSMSGSFEDIDVPPTLISFAAAIGDTNHLLSPELKQAGSRLIILEPSYDQHNLPQAASLKANMAALKALIEKGQVMAGYALGNGGLMAALAKMAFGNQIGFELAANLDETELFAAKYGSFVLELAADADLIGRQIGQTSADYQLKYQDQSHDLAELEQIYQQKLEPIFPLKSPIENTDKIPTYNYTEKSLISPKIKRLKPRVLIPAFPGTNCEYDVARAFELAGAEAKILVIRNLEPAWLNESREQIIKELQNSQIIALPGGFSGGDEPEGSGKFIANFLRQEPIKQALYEMLFANDGLMLGICNGFQALIKLGLVPFGEIRDMDQQSPTLSYNQIGRHQSKMVNIRVASVKSPWLCLAKPGENYTLAISHGEGRFICPPDLLKKLADNGQICSQYTDLAGNVSMDITANPNGSLDAIESICSPDGRIFGQMAHPERYLGGGNMLNISGNTAYPIFNSALAYFK